MKFSDIRRNPKVNSIGEYFGTISIGLFIFQINLFMFIFIFKKSIWSLHILSFLFICFFVLIFKDFANEKQKKIGFALFKISLLIVVMASISHIMITGLSKIQTQLLYKKMSTMVYFINLTIIIASVAFYKNPSSVTILETMYNESLLDKILGQPDEEFKPGDARLGIDLDTKKPVRVPFTDRFLHFLFLGPTGSGKTSQSLLPMINDDLQFKESGMIVLEPKGDLAEKVYAMAKIYNRKVLYFNPVMPDCPYFNPLFGKESDVVENMATTFKMLNPFSPQFFLDMNENLAKKAIKVIKRVKGNDATFIDLSNLINGFNEGRDILNKFSRLGGDSNFVTENLEIYQWFKNDYFTGLAGGSKGGTKTFEHCSGLRSQVAKIISNEYLRKVLNPPEGMNDIDFDTALAEGHVITIATAQGTLRDLGRFLGYFIILQLQSSVFRRPGHEDTRRPCFLFIDEFQIYSNPGFTDMLTMGRSYRVASHLATQNRALIGMGSGNDGKNFIEAVSTNARNVVIYPGGNYNDADYYSKQFGEIIQVTQQKGETHQKFNPLYGLNIKAPTVSIRNQENTVARYSPTNIIYRPFKQVTYCIIKNNSIQTPGISTLDFIPVELKEEIDRIVNEYNLLQDEISGNKLQQVLENNNKANNFSPNVDIPDDAVIKPPSPVINNHKNYNDVYGKKEYGDETTSENSNYEKYQEDDEDYITVDDEGAKTKNGPVIDKDDYRFVENNLNIGDEEDNLI